ncbi:MAG: phage tail protein [Proteobacteria bacterium]|nr:phage tail protein [Pseudomonadota bacterium]
MAVSKEDIGQAYPLPVYNYKVEIGADTVAFSEVSGLNITYETTTYKESPTESGTPGPRILYMPAQRSAVNVTLKKGLVRGISIRHLYSWINATQLNQNDKKDIFIRLCDENGDAVISWKVNNAFPTKLDVPTFDANSNDVAIESMELMADRVTIEEA